MSFALVALALILPAGAAAPQETSQAVETSGAQATRLERRKPATGRIIGGQTDTYSIALGTGEYVRVEIEHDPVDLLFRVSAPDGTIDLEERATAARRTVLDLTAEQTATYELRIGTAYPRARDAAYRIRLGKPRRASERDRVLHDARRGRTASARLLEIGDSVGAVEQAERALGIVEPLLKPDDPELAIALQSVAAAEFGAGRYQRATALFRRALAIAARAFGEDDLRVADIENSLAKSPVIWGDLAEAERLAGHALASRETKLGPDHILTAESAGTAAQVRMVNGDFAGAGELAERALATASKTYDPDTLPYQWFATRAADVQARLGNYARAEELLENALRVRERDAASESADLADSLFGLAFLYLQKRDNLRAAEFGLRALRIDEAILGQDHPRLVKSLNALGLLSLRSRDFRAAEAHFLRALKINETTFGPSHYSLAPLINNLGLVYWREGDLAKAKVHYERTVALIEARFGPESPNLAGAIGNLGIIAKETGDWQGAESYYERSVRIFETAHGPSYPPLVVPLESLGILYRDRGEYARAEPYFTRVLQITEGSVGPDHPDVARHLSNLGQLYASGGETTKARQAMGRRTAIRETILPLQLAVGSERQKLAYFEPLITDFDEVTSFLVNQNAEDAATRDLALTTLLQRKGRILDVMADSLGAFRERSSAEDRARFDEVTRVTSALARLVLNGPNGQPLAEHQRQIEALDRERDGLEAELSRRTARYYERRSAVTLEAVKAAIPPDVVLVEFGVYKPFDPKAAAESDAVYGEPRYIAYVMTRHGEVRWKDLGPAKPIDDAVDALRQTLRDPKRSDVRDAARALDTKIMAPLRALYGDTSRLLIAPDGQLHLIPFEALVGDDGRYLIERHAITYLSSGRDLLRMAVVRPSRSKPLLVADPFFGEPAAPESAERVALASPPPAVRGDPNRPRTATASRGITTGGDLANVYFAPLTGTAHEARSIKALFPEASILTRSEATEASLKMIDAPAILHIATHGFFLGDPAAAAETSADDTRAIQAKTTIENPLLRSGLALSGANLDGTGADDGILTALEASSLDLWGTKLVTLSACDTGVGEVRNGEGVYGLRRAFFLAGTETLVMSLWPVSDYVTRRMMTAYYGGLKSGLGRGDALRQAQLAMLRQSGRHHPFYWASFIQSGEWGSLDGRR